MWGGTARPGELWVSEDYAPRKLIPTSKSLHAARPSPGPSMQLERFESQAHNSDLTCEHTPPRMGGGRLSTTDPHAKGTAGEEPRHSPDSRQSVLAVHAPRSEGNPRQRCCRDKRSQAPTVSTGRGLAPQLRQAGSWLSSYLSAPPCFPLRSGEEIPAPTYPQTQG